MKMSVWVIYRDCHSQARVYCNGKSEKWAILTGPGAFRQCLWCSDWPIMTIDMYIKVLLCAYSRQVYHRKGVNCFGHIHLIQSCHIPINSIIIARCNGHKCGNCRMPLVLSCPLLSPSGAGLLCPSPWSCYSCMLLSVPTLNIISHVTCYIQHTLFSHFLVFSIVIYFSYFFCIFSLVSFYLFSSTIFKSFSSLKLSPFLFQSSSLQLRTFLICI